jgi:hypothetical protein
MSSQYDVTGYGQHGTKYHSEFQRLSGSPETAAFNSDITARTVYTAYRMSTNPKTGTFYTMTEAWNKLCMLAMVGGDDSYAADIDPQIYVKAAALYGQVLEVDIVKRGDSGFNFLSRFYTSRVWYGETASTCDLQRQLRKFHVTVHLPTNVTPVMKLVEKCRSFYCSDKNTPILGELSTYVQKLASTQSYDLIERNDLNIFTLSREADQQYPNDLEPEDLQSELTRSKLDLQAVVRMLEFLDTQPTLEEIVTNMPLLVEPEDGAPKLKGAVTIDDGSFPETLTPLAPSLNVEVIKVDTTATSSTTGVRPTRQPSPERRMPFVPNKPQPTGPLKLSDTRTRQPPPERPNRKAQPAEKRKPQGQRPNLKSSPDKPLAYDKNRPARKPLAAKRNQPKCGSTTESKAERRPQDLAMIARAEKTRELENQTSNSGRIAEGDDPWAISPKVTASEAAKINGMADGWY